ncbi:MAG TPA: haloalkane dehalogenase [Polyangiaceae bacterium]|nr:haloalkane dehalogenase [Polyangiaceae bacterium]
MKALRTPDRRFASLPDFPFAPRYVEVPSGDGGSLRMHYVDEGPRGAEPVLMLHGEPSWCFLYRKVIRVVAGAGLRAVAPDLVGFGRSDKPADPGDYTYQRHVDWARAFVEALGLERVTLLCQDWGGLIGLRLVAEHPERFARVVAANTSLPTGDRRPPDAFFAWQTFSQRAPELKIGDIVQAGCARPLAPEIVAAYDAPFPDESYKAGARRFPLLVPSSPDDPASEPNRRAWASLATFDKPFLTAFGDSDPITAGAERAMQKKIPGAAGRAHVTLPRAGHFLQEDAGEELGRVVADFVRG